ncbi:MAG TPA: hypothetical protein VGG65_03570, partial [Thermoanaerobaculia bacterium]
RCAGAAAADPAASARHELLWNVSVAAWRRFPILGSGLGTFREAFRGVQPRDLRELVDQAPSGSIDLLVTGGLAGVLFGIIFFAALLTAFHRAWRLQIHREESATALAAIGALLLWLLLWTIDPAALRLVGSPLLAIILGAGWAAAQTSGGRIV